MIDVQLAASTDCLQPNEFWIGVAVHLGILFLVFGTLFIWGKVRK